MTQGIQKQGWRLPAIEAELHFGKIGREMVRADLVPRSNDAALEQGECGFNRVGINIPANVLLVATVDGFMLAIANGYGLR
jgi:hypothetical protein